MAAPLLNHLSKDLYKLLHLPRTATQNEIKQSYRKIAMALHPDKHDGCTVKTSEFKEVSEAYRVLSNYNDRVEYDRWLDGVSLGADGRVHNKGGGASRSGSRAAERNPFYRKVYSPAAPPGMKTFDRQRHYDMHYGQGMMNEEIERARKRAEAASPRNSGNSYQSPLGAGFSFDGGRPMDQQMNPYSRKGKRQHDHINQQDKGFRIEYQEAHFDMNGSSDLSGTNAIRSKEFVVERMKGRRKYRMRERDEPNPYRKRHTNDDGGDESSGCVIM